MLRLLKFPLLFFFIASVIGVVLRWHLHHPISGFEYSYWLHAHSHLMFLGWVFNALSVAFIHYFIPADVQSKFNWLLIVLNILVAAMLISFPLQGYGFYSILISTFHTIGVVIYYVLFLRYSKIDYDHIALKFVKASLLFFLLSAIGPFALGALVANGLGNTPWYSLAVYYYLHFQYNGVFTFGVLALVFKLFESHGLKFNKRSASIFYKLLFVACFPAYALSALWATTEPFVVALGFLAALLQLVAVGFFMHALPRFKKIQKQFTRTTKLLLVAALLSFLLKIILQKLSAFPAINMLAYEIRWYVIGYLHLVLLGVISFALLAWYVELFKLRIGGMFWFLFSGFAISEAALITIGKVNVSMLLLVLVAASALMVVGIGGILYKVLLMTKQPEQLK